MLLQGFRGEPPADVEALAAAAVRLGDLFVASPAIQELKLNPIIVNRRGQGLRVVDALVVCADVERLALQVHGVPAGVCQTFCGAKFCAITLKPSAK